MPLRKGFITLINAHKSILTGVFREPKDEIVGIEGVSDGGFLAVRAT